MRTIYSTSRPSFHFILKSLILIGFVLNFFPDLNTDTWDCIATVFFIDTAHNILSYLDTIWRILKPGGYWINFGPLLYHFSDIPGEDSLELSYTELRLAIKRLGFEIVREKSNIQCGYTQNSSSMLSYNYNCVYGLFRKPFITTISPTTETNVTKLMSTLNTTTSTINDME
ncbi:Carnosine N-methyltransferase [Schistosoma haematobium]|uniref:carnosine N-methyltransferase n=1 Tax=Schistosoma haematobium TaxID=6185 RepID=A0A922IJF4_SCHHA|nr:Carnosine N-methyltransferase [Schistosoma haematobium]KAH9580884.1 Carnosine N-methyltransferase [Schistosoma haematobium]